jgi:hypothetical protein
MADKDFMERVKSMNLDEISAYYRTTKIISRVIDIAGISAFLICLFFPNMLVIGLSVVVVIALGGLAQGFEIVKNALLDRLNKLIK